MKQPCIIHIILLLIQILYIGTVTTLCCGMLPLRLKVFPALTPETPSKYATTRLPFLKKGKPYKERRNLK